LTLTEYNFDGLAGPTHGYSGLSPGNLASERHAGASANPRAAALQGLGKMRFLTELGVHQAVLPPQPRPDVASLRRWGFSGSDAEVVARALACDETLVRWASSASAMWTANAATVAPSTDTSDGRLHLTVANLSSMVHRSLEAATTYRVLGRIFADEERFAVHEPLPGPGAFSDEGAANHCRLASDAGRVHLFAWGRSASGAARTAPRRYPARQTREASEAVARLNQVGDAALSWRQAPDGIDAGAFHTDVLALGNENVLLLHELAFVDAERLIGELGSRLGANFRACLARSDELPVADAVASYPFNSQLVTLPDRTMALVAPEEARQNPAALRYLERVQAQVPEVGRLCFVDVNASMKNGGGPACLRLRVPLCEDERNAVTARVFAGEALLSDLEAWVRRRYRDRFTLHDLGDPEFLRELETALDELSTLLGLGSVYEFQRA
jgi:succinylarginine dihydrolase